MSNIGRTIFDHYCNGLGNTVENLSGSTIEAEGQDWIILRTIKKNPIFIDFHKYTNKKEELITAWCERHQQLV
ncbi:hypothetical protein IFO69_01070 [Echinicola sp. CAU 1574]|uniref:Uncharacterized protein n=1 Tax=Echinicola arenosa TaxID=2774144 RepID=A0ABR9AF65_9BACT|nr:hypothetical protein [Echinicola arenosa]MBD8487328.1 hypothetical protein [Echinicola arenosa]